jgi:hypothetical protein
MLRTQARLATSHSTLVGPKNGPPMKRVAILAAVTLYLLGVPQAHAQAASPSAVLRIACEGDARDAEVHVNGVFKGQCPVDVPVPEGEVQVRVTKSAGTPSERVFVQTLRMAAGTAKRLDVVLGASQREAAQVQQAADTKARQEVALRATCDSGQTGQMLETSDAAVLKQACTGLLWTRSDNGRDVTWSEAQSWCRRQGAGWSLPTLQQLKSLLGVKTPSIDCGGEGKWERCNVSDRFRLSQFTFWSSEPARQVDGRLLILRTGDPASNMSPGMSQGFRALCVRQP